jgi:hypothetical protein
MGDGLQLLWSEFPGAESLALDDVLGQGILLDVESETFDGRISLPVLCALIKRWWVASG